MTDPFAAASSGGLASAVPPRGAAQEAADPGRLYTATFVLTWIATFAIFASYYLLLPTLPLYALSLGSSTGQVGLVLGLYTGASMVIRLCVAPAMDRSRRKPYMVAGAAVFLASALAYFFAGTLPGLLALRTVHGCGMGVFMTAATALVTDVAPVRRRGEALGAYGLAIHVGMAFAPALGTAVLNRTSFQGLFFAAAVAAAATLALAVAIPGGAQPAPSERPTPALRRIFSLSALFPSAVMLGQTMAYGAALSFVPVWGQGHRLENPGGFFTGYALAMLAVRTRAGRISDRFGRGPVIVPGLALLAAGMALLAAVSRPWHLLAAGVIMGIGMGAVQPALGALLTDRAPEAERARAFAMFYGAFEGGVALGSVGAGWLLEVASFPAMWLAAAGAPVAAAIAFCVGEGRRRRPGGAA